MPKFAVVTVTTVWQQRTWEVEAEDSTAASDLVQEMIADPKTEWPDVDSDDGDGTEIIEVQEIADENAAAAFESYPGSCAAHETYGDSREE